MLLAHLGQFAFQARSYWLGTMKPHQCVGRGLFMPIQLIGAICI
jgi:hypothetical protein